MAYELPDEIRVDVDGPIHREARIGRVHGRRIVDAVAEKADHVSHPLRGKDDSLFLIGIDLGKEVRVVNGAPERGTVQAVKLATVEEPV